MGKKSKKQSALEANPAEFGSSSATADQNDNADSKVSSRRSKRQKEGGDVGDEVSPTWLTDQPEDSPPYGMQVFVWLAVFVGMQFVTSFAMKKLSEYNGEDKGGGDDTQSDGGEL